MNRVTRFAVGSLASLALLAAAPLSASAATKPPLGAANSFVVLGGAGVTCTKSSVTGIVGSKTTVTETPSCNINGAIHQGDATAVNAFSAFSTSYNTLNALTCPAANNLTASRSQLAGQTLPPGVYCIDTTKTALLTSGNLTLSGPSSGAWVFQIARDMTTDTAQVIMAGGGKACNVYWVLGTQGTIGQGTKFQGNMLAGSAVAFTGTNSSLVGRAFAKTAVAMTGTNVRLPLGSNTLSCRRLP
jgi:hypothetical protein